MAVVRILMVVIGLLAIAFGLLFTMQGFGLVRCPSSSFMIDDRGWSLRGALLIAGGALMAWYGRRVR